MPRAARLHGPRDALGPSPARGRRGEWVAGLLAVILLGALTPAAGQGPSDTPLPFLTIAAGRTSGVHTPGQVVVRSEADWSALWRQHGGPGAGTAPPVDFSRDMVIAVFAGEVRGPAALAIFRITRDPDRLVVWYTFRDTRPMPAAGGGVAFAPFSIIRLARSSLPVSFFQVKTPQLLRQRP